MFRFHKTLDVITLFHKPALSTSIRVHSLLKQASATAATTATEDQASDHSTHTHTPLKRNEFQLDITEEPPTPEQLENIISYLGPLKIPTIIKGAKTEAEAMRKFKESSENFQRPVTVDWENGKAVAGDNKSEILKLVDGLSEK